MDTEARQRRLLHRAMHIVRHNRLHWLMAHAKFPLASAAAAAQQESDMQAAWRMHCLLTESGWDEQDLRFFAARLRREPVEMLRAAVRIMMIVATQFRHSFLIVLPFFHELDPEMSLRMRALRLQQKRTRRQARATRITVQQHARGAVPH